MSRPSHLRRDQVLDANGSTTQDSEVKRRITKALLEERGVSEPDTARDIDPASSRSSRTSIRAGMMLSAVL